MAPITLVLLAIALLAALPAAAELPPGGARSRGELLYATHCIGCHTTQVHWRQKKLARDWASLVREVRRWTATGALNWTNDEIAEVARYLNATQYHYPVPSGTELGRGGVPTSVARTD